jgi:hypothetical protein
MAIMCAWFAAFFEKASVSRVIATVAHADAEILSLGK